METIHSSDEEINKYIIERIRQIETASNKPFEMLVRDLVSDYVLYGNAMWYLYRDIENSYGNPYIDFDGKQTKPISAVFNVPIRFVSYDVNNNRYVIDEDIYEQFADISVYRTSEEELVYSQNKAIDNKNIIHIKSEDNGEIFPGGFQSRALNTLVILASLEDIAEDMLENRQFYVTIYKVGSKEKPGTQEDIAIVKQSLENEPEGGILVIPGNHDIDIKNMSSLGDIKQYMDYFKTKLLNELGISSIGMGEGGQANRATAEEANSITYDLVKSIQDTFAQQFNFYFLRQLLKEKKGFDKKKIFKLSDEELPKIIFPEPDSSLMVKLNTHEIYKFEHSIQTEDETRRNLKMPQLTEEKRKKLFQNIYGTTGSLLETNNIVQPQNQHTQN